MKTAPYQLLVIAYLMHLQLTTVAEDCFVFQDAGFCDD
jgi:hypothetical protein